MAVGDCFTKWIEAYAILNQEVTIVAQALFTTSAAVMEFQLKAIWIKEGILNRMSS